MQYTKECLYDVQWQMLRVDLLGESGEESWVESLCKYVWLEDKSQESIWRVLNLCNATLLSYGKRDMGMRRVRVETLQKHCQDHYVGLGFKSWDWEKVKDDLGCLIRLNRQSFMLIKADLEKRVKTSQYKARKRGELDNVSGFKHRSELEYFLQLMEETCKSV